MIVQQDGIKGEVGWEKESHLKINQRLLYYKWKNENPIWAGPFCKVCYWTFCLKPGQHILYWSNIFFTWSATGKLVSFCCLGVDGALGRLCFIGTHAPSQHCSLWTAWNYDLHEELCLYSSVSLWGAGGLVIVNCTSIPEEEPARGWTTWANWSWTEVAKGGLSFD